MSTESQQLFDSKTFPGSLSRFYTSTIGAGESDDRSAEELMQEAIDMARDAWPEGSQYQIESVIAVGGMGAILKVWDSHAHRHVAMKVMLRGNADSPDADRFIKEARIVANLEHPNIVPVHDIGESPMGEPYFTMKWVQGENLADVLYKLRSNYEDYVERYTLSALLDIFLQILNGVAFAHSRHIIHLDLKPHNLLVGDYGEVVVLDWGLARYFDDDEPLEGGPAGIQGMPATSSMVTREGTIKGTPGFMAPEQADGRIDALDVSTDVFALGAILYMMLTLKSPIVGSSPSELLQHTRKGNFVRPGQRVFRPVPPQLEAIVMKAMALNPADRYQSVSQFQADLQAYMRGFATSVDDSNLSTQLLLFVRRQRSVVTLVSASLAVTAILAGAFMVKLHLQQRETNKHKESLQTQSKAAEVAHNLATRRHAVAMERQKEVEEHQEAAAWQDYLAKIRLAEIAIGQGQFALARDSLKACPPKYRNWEWGRLTYRTELAEISVQHDAPLVALDVSKNGRLVAVATEDRSIVIRRVSDGRLERQIVGLKAAVRDLCFDDDGDRIITADSDGKVRVRGMNGAQSLMLVGHQGALTSLALAGDGKRLLTGSIDRTAILWYLDNGKKRRTLRGHRGAILAVAISIDGKWLLTGSLDGTARLWDSTSPRATEVLQGHDGAVTAVALDHASNLAVTAGEDQTIRVWRLRDGKLLRVIPAHTSAVTDVAISGDGRLIGSTSVDGTAKLWRVDDGSLQAELRGHEAALTAIGLSTSGTAVYTTSNDHRLMIWDGNSAGDQRVIRAHRGTLNAIAAAEDGETLATGGSDGSVRLWNIQSGEALATMPGHSKPVTGLGFLDSGRLVSTGKDGLGRIWDIKSKAPLAELKGHTGPITGLQLRDSRVIATISLDLSIRLWQPDGTQLALGKSDGLAFTMVAVADRGYLTGDAAGNVTLWSMDLANRKTKSLSTSAITALDVDGTQVVVGDRAGRIIAWDLESDTTAELGKHRHEVVDLGFSPDGQRIASCTSAGIQIWDRNGTEMAMLVGAAPIQALGWSQNRLIAGDRVGYARAWTANSWRESAQ